MRVLHIYSGNLYGGIETMLVTLAREREVCPQMEPHFALCFEGRLSEELSSADVPVHQLGNVRASRPATVLHARNTLRKLLRSLDFDAAICHAPWSQAIFGAVVREAGVPLIFWMHGTTDGRHWAERWARRTPPDLAICNSRFTASTLNNLYPRVRAEVLFYPVAFAPSHNSEDERRATRAELDTPEDTTVIIQVSRMEAWKGHTLHLEALTHLRDVPGWVCWLVGGAQRPQEIQYLAELKETVMRSGLAERVRFLGERSDIPRLLAAADIHCQPNIQPEPFGITFIEALNARLPVVTTAMGGAQEIIDDSCGILVPPGDAGKLSSALNKLLADKGLRVLLGETGRVRAHTLCDPARQMKHLHSALVSLAQLEMAG
ncbi:MAG: glycosyltransferase [Pyrinomonadaceae bacterium]|nr:glycosyltransferase [Pyrinomonadaceae bacterium]